jgi:hypothetical protein
MNTANCLEYGQSARRRSLWKVCLVGATACAIVAAGCRWLPGSLGRMRYLKTQRQCLTNIPSDNRPIVKYLETGVDAYGRVTADRFYRGEPPDLDEYERLTPCWRFERNTLGNPGYTDCTLYLHEITAPDGKRLLIRLGLLVPYAFGHGARIDVWALEPATLRTDARRLEVGAYMTMDKARIMGPRVKS